jgi:lipid A 4'-phosphatase
MNKNFLHVPVFIWTAFIISSLIFVFFPQIDIYISGLLYDPKYGFTANGTWYEDILYNSVKPIIFIAIALPILIWIYNIFTKKNLLHINGKVIGYLLLVLAIGPGLIVNDLFKEHWGRARPAQTVIFGGQKEFTPAYVISDQGGYSFSSGHTAGAFFLVALALLARRNRAFWMSLAFVYGILVSYVRIAAGGHFFSDTVVSFFIVYITSLMLYGIIFKGKSHTVS